MNIRLELSYYHTIFLITGLFLGYSILALPKTLALYAKSARKAFAIHPNKARTSRRGKIKDKIDPMVNI